MYNSEMVSIQIPMDVLVRAVQAAGVTDRLHDMINTHGEVCSRYKACKILHVGDEHLQKLLQEGKILPACEGESIDVRSLADYIERKNARNGRRKL